MKRFFYMALIAFIARGVIEVFKANVGFGLVIIMILIVIFLYTFVDRRRLKYQLRRKSQEGKK